MLTYVFVHTLVIDLGVTLGVALYIHKTNKQKKAIANALDAFRKEK